MKQEQYLHDELDMIQFMEENNMIDMEEAAYFRMRTESLLRNMSRGQTSGVSLPKGGAQ